MKKLKSKDGRKKSTSAKFRKKNIGRECSKKSNSGAGIVLLEWKREFLKVYKVSDLNRKIKEDIFEGQKWHKENGQCRF